MVKNRDAEIAKEYLIKNNVSLVIVKDSKVVVQKTDRGIKPLFESVTNEYERINKGAIADKVIGKAAAMLSVKANISFVYAKMISESAIKVLEENNIPVEYGIKVPFILNRNKTDSCPVEKIAKEQDNIEQLINEIHKFLKQ